MIAAQAKVSWYNRATIQGVISGSSFYCVVDKRLNKSTVRIQKRIVGSERRFWVDNRQL